MRTPDPWECSSLCDLPTQAILRLEAMLRVSWCASAFSGLDRKANSNVGGQMAVPSLTKHALEATFRGPRDDGSASARGSPGRPLRAFGWGRGPDPPPGRL